MITSVEISKYRGFESFQIGKLARVNLLVGRNNCGKTALLESVHFLASGGDPSVLVDVATRRGEYVFGSREESGQIDISHFFHGHEVCVGSRFEISGSGGVYPVVVEATSLGDSEADSELFEYPRSLPPPALAMRVSCGRGAAIRARTFYLSEDGALLVDPRRGVHRWFRDERRAGPSIAFISPESLVPGALGGMWNQVLREKQEREVREAMGLLEDDLDDIVFQTGESMNRYSPSRSGVLVSFKGDRRRVPLGSMGDGMRRLLALSISLINAKGGYLIIDEIDTGFHYSIMAKMWALVVKTAVRNDIQVFATTHSADCIRGLGVLCDRDPELRKQVAAHKIERHLKHSVALTGSDIMDAVRQDIEIR
ncbi:MAG: ATP-binding protein [Rhodoferax sp.]